MLRVMNRLGLCDETSDAPRDNGITVAATGRLDTGCEEVWGTCLKTCADGWYL